MGKRLQAPSSRAARRRQQRAAPRRGPAALPRWLWPALAAALVALVFAAFWPTLWAGFVAMDDGQYVYENPHVLQGLTPASVAWAWDGFYLGYTIPLTWVSLMLDADRVGASPGGYHLTNVLLHAGGAVLLMLALRRATGSAWRAALAAALWAVHPLRVESVAWVTERKDVLAGVFGFAALYAYAWYASAAAPGGAAARPAHDPVGTFLRFAREDRRFRFGVVVVAFCLSLLSKPTLVVTMPAVLWLLDVWPLGRMGTAGGRPPCRAWALAVEKWPLVLAAALVTAVTAYGQYRAGKFEGDVVIGTGARLANAVVAPVRYVAKMVDDRRLAVFYPFPLVWDAAAVAGSAALLLVVSAAVLWQRRRRPWLAVGWFWFMVALVPALWVPAGLLSTPLADRFTYFPAAGLAILVVWSIPAAWAATAGRRAALAAGAAACLAVLLAATRAQSAYWHDSVSLFRHAVAVTDENWFARHNLAKALADEGENAEALAHFRESLRLNPNYFTGWTNEAFLLNRMGPDHAAEALACADEAVRRGPAYLPAHVERAIALEALDRHEEVVRECEAVLRLDTESVLAHNFLGIALIELGRRDEGVAHLRASLRIDPENLQARHNLSWALGRPPATTPASLPSLPSPEGAAPRRGGP